MRLLCGTCLWCGGAGNVVCALCDEPLQCMFCLGDGKYHAAPQAPAHVCKSRLAEMPVKQGKPQ